MDKKTVNKGLGKGFNALFPNSDQDFHYINKTIVQEIPLTQIVNNPNQPRRKFPLVELEELAQSIRNKGIIQPIILRAKDASSFEIIAGERRWRAAKMAGLIKVKSIVYNVPEKEVREIALIENIQRKDLNPIEEAATYHSLLEEKYLTHEELARKVGKNRSTITNLLRLLALPQEIIEDIINESITIGHAKYILALKTTKEMLNIKDLIITKKLSVRETEREIKKLHNLQKKKLGDNIKVKKQDNLFKEYQDNLANILLTNVEIKDEMKGGKILIQFYNKEDLQRIVKIVSNTH